MGVIVLGMHRSGTSAVTGAIAQLGLHVGEPQMAPADDNPTGFFEVDALMHLDDELLAHLGGTWDDPPLPEPGWERAPDLADLRGRAEHEFSAAHPLSRWVWKDPRACVLLPFWFDVLGRDHALVVVLRDPAPIARSLATRNDLSVDATLRVWERSMLGVLRDAVGLPALVLRYDDVVDAPLTAVANVDSYLRRCDLDSNGDTTAAANFIQSNLRHGRVDDVRLPAGATTAQRRLLEVLDGLVGTHDALPAESWKAVAP